MYPLVPRTVHDLVNRFKEDPKAIVLVGPRQVGKTTLIDAVLQDESYLSFNGDNPSDRTLLDTPNTSQLRDLLSGYSNVLIDQAQRINNIGLTLKIITDQLPDVKLWVSGSSSFELFNTLNEPLTGRKWEFELFPISWEEYESHVGQLEAVKTLNNRLVYGFYPEVINGQGNERLILTNLVSNYLYRDLYSHGGIKRPEVLDRIVQALALQLGSEVNFGELSQLVGVDKATVQRYIDVLEKGYVIFRLRSFSRNLRNELKKQQKIYFYDNGVRNAIIGQLDPIVNRPDVGALWENFLVAERRKQNSYKNTFARTYFWRTRKQQEVDYVEEIGYGVHGYEFKWNPKRIKPLPKTFVDAYSASASTVTRENFRDFVILDSQT